MLTSLYGSPYNKCSLVEINECFKRSSILQKSQSFERRLRRSDCWPFVVLEFSYRFPVLILDVVCNAINSAGGTGYRKLPNGNQKLSSMSDVGLINQRYMINLRGTSQAIEISSTAELFQVTKHFTWLPDKWYMMKTQVIIKPEANVGIIRAKVWPRGEEEPKDWTIEAQHKSPHESGSPGIYGFAPRVAVYVDNVSALPNENH